METRYERLAREQAERQAARAERMKPKRRKAVRLESTMDRRTADKIDGYDRDDLGESPDY